MYDLYGPVSGTRGTIIGIDDSGKILMNWETGSSLSLIVGVDEFTILK